MTLPSYIKPIFTDKSLSTDGITIVLSTRARVKLGEIHNIDYSSINNTCELINGNSLSFDVYKTLNGEDEPLWDQIMDLKLIYVPELDDYLEITITDTDSLNQKKSVSAVSAGIAELSQTYIHNFEANTEADIERPDYVVTKFYDPINPKGSLLHRILEKTPQYSLGYVDDSLKNLQRTITCDGESVWDLLSNTVANAFNCMFLVDNLTKKLYAIDLEINCQDCGERFEYAPEDEVGVCPNCGGSNLSYFGKDTTLYADKENLTDEITVTVNAESIKNTLKLAAGDDLMTATVRALNPNGTDYINKFNAESFEDMPTQLVDKIISYQQLYDSLQPTYQTIMENLYNAYDWKLWYESVMMPGGTAPDGTVMAGQRPQIEVTAATEAAKLTTATLSPVAMTSISASTQKKTVDNAVCALARTLVYSGYVKVEVNSSTWSYVSGSTRGTWRGTLKITTFSSMNKEDGERDTAITSSLVLAVNDDYETYINQYLYKNVAAAAERDDGTIYDVLKINSLANYKEAIKVYCANRLESFRDALEGCLGILAGEVNGKKAQAVSDFKSEIYDPYKAKLDATVQELNRRNASITFWDEQITNYSRRKSAIQTQLDFRKYLGENLYKIYCAYRREDRYENSNYISDGLDNAQTFARAREFLTAAQKQMNILTTPQYTVSFNLFNILNKGGFSDEVSKFVLGNWMRVRADGKLFRVRMIKYSYNLGNLNEIQVEFSNVTRADGVVSDIQSILNSAKSMATSYGTTGNMAQAGQFAADTDKAFYRSGLIDANKRIKMNNDETITMDKFGVLAREYDDVTETYKDEQLRITHNILAFTADGWDSVEVALGKHTYVTFNESTKKYVNNEAYGLSARFVQAGQINGSQITGGDIYSTALLNSVPVTHIDLDNGTFSFAGGKLTYENNTLTMLNGTIKAGHIYSSDGSTTHINLDNGTFSFAGGQLTYKNGTLSLTGDVNATGGSIDGNNCSITNISGGNIKSGTITGTQISAGAISTAKLAANAVTAEKIQAGTITATEIALNTITAAEIAAGAIGTSELQANAVTAGKIDSGAITADKIAARTITANKIEAGAITAYEIKSGTITAEKIQAGTITGDKIAANTITAAKINVDNLVVKALKSGTYISSVGNIGFEITSDGHVSAGAGSSIGVDSRMQFNDGFTSWHGNCFASPLYHAVGPKQHYCYSRDQKSKHEISFDWTDSAFEIYVDGSKVATLNANFVGK